MDCEDYLPELKDNRPDIPDDPPLAVRMVTIPLLDVLLYPLSRFTKPPVAVKVVSPESSVNVPPDPDVPLPTVSTIAPPRPLVAAPLPIDIEPLLPLDAVPELKINKPLVPEVPEFAVRT